MAQKKKYVLYSLPTQSRALCAQRTARILRSPKCLKTSDEKQYCFSSLFRVVRFLSQFRLCFATHRLCSPENSFLGSFLLFIFLNMFWFAYEWLRVNTKTKQLCCGAPVWVCVCGCYLFAPEICIVLSRTHEFGGEGSSLHTFSTHGRVLAYEMIRRKAANEFALPQNTSTILVSFSSLYGRKSKRMSCSQVIALIYLLFASARLIPIKANSIYFSEDWKWTEKAPGEADEVGRCVEKYFRKK